MGPGDPPFLFGANGSKIRILGKTSLSVKLHGLTVPFDFLIAERLTHEIILGHDFLTETKALINYADSSVTFFENLVEMKILKNNYDAIASLTCSCALPPLSETIVNVRLSRNFSGDSYLLELLPMREKQSISSRKVSQR